MTESLSLQPRRCEECGRQEMYWGVLAADTDQQQNASKDTNSNTFDTLFGQQTSVSEKSKSEGLEELAGEVESFNLCSDPTCKGHSEALGNLVRWKLRNVSPYEYSNNEIEQVVAKTVEQSIRDYQTVTETVSELSESVAQDTESEQSIEDSIGNERTTPAPTEKETPPQQLDRCECGERQKPTQTSAGTTATEGESVKDSNRSAKSLKVAVSALPFVNVDVGGETEEGTETTTKEKTRVETMDTATFPICPDLSCEEHLLMRGQIECWKMRNDSSRDYTDEEVGETVTETIEQEIRDDKIITESVADVRSRMLGDSPNQTQTTNERMASFIAAFNNETVSYVALGEIKDRKRGVSNSPSPSEGAISARLAETRPSIGEGTTTSEGTNTGNDTDKKKGPGGASL